MTADVRVSSLLVQHHGLLLLGRRARSPDAEAWVPPGGKARRGESLAAAGVRELLEETGLDVEVLGPPGECGTFPHDWEGVTYQVTYSSARVVGHWGHGAPITTPADDLDAARFFSREELRSLPLGCTARLCLTRNGWL